ncbi:MAG TPA: exodeoxyribonuclease V subunit alpha [Candidatus Binataceae bacterium]|nr:exodeoxyribonuclease V subunit alpha [Candidatus Binataceae bacterium]
MSAPRVQVIESAWQRFEHRSGGDATTLEAFATLAESLNLSRDAVQIAAEIASFETSFTPEQRDALMALVLVVLGALADGSTCFPVTGSAGAAALKPMLRALADTKLGSEAPERFAAAIEKLLDGNLATQTIARDENEYKPLVYLKPFIYMRKLRAAERELAQGIRAMISSEPTPFFSSDECASKADEVCAIPVAIQSGMVLLSGEQRAAIAAAARQRFTVISGGPGTGKTSIVIAILRLMVRLGLDPHAISLAAPTGKAANRIGECIVRALNSPARPNAIDRALRDAAIEPTTLHRLLGYSPSSQRYRHHRNNPLAARLVIVDEGSMLDLALMERLVGAIDEGARLIVLGDADQLPSVAAGAVFREFAASEQSRRLVQNFRMRSSDAAGNSILTVARRINEGLAAGDDVPRRSSADDLAMSGVEMLDSTRPAMKGFFDRWYAERIAGDATIAELKRSTYVEGADGFGSEDVERLRRLFNFVAASRILTVTRARETGADWINRAMHRRAAGGGFRADDRLLPGEPVIAIRNDYERMLFNGDNGIALRVRRAEGGAAPLMAVFPRRDNFAAFRVDMIRDALELAYAMTVHKAQGSEFDAVALILPESRISLFTREVVYTAVSRARRSVVIAGSETVLDEAIAAPAQRYSGLRELFAAS